MNSKTKYDTTSNDVDQNLNQGTININPNTEVLVNNIHSPEFEKILGEAMGNQFANSMAEEGFHPVLIFGAPASGKTAFLLSLIKYMFVGSASDSQIRLSLEYFPNESLSIRRDLIEQDKERWFEVKKYANILFNKHATDFLQSNQIASATDVSYPFFIPIEITPKKEGLKPLKIAFLEGKGEWYSPKFDDESRSPHQTFRPEILAFLEHYPGSITSVFVAPYAVESYESNIDGESSASAPKIRERDFALYGLIDQFEKFRSNQIGSDNYLYLMTKWDIRCGSISNPDFIYNDIAILKGEIQAKFPMSFNRFQNIKEISLDNRGNKHISKKTVSAYCAGIMRASVISLPTESRVRVDHFSRKLWNYFYLNSNNEYLDACAIVFSNTINNLRTLILSKADGFVVKVLSPNSTVPCPGKVPTGLIPKE
jgi:GTPase SAR1 family protein